ncbi:hypothetical protein ACP8HI_17605 [Paenibacillus sp. FA6]|uniref:hypothetical protein n=1 Tax=Paenibacillus sp. FA6 TaxID=3413029 RepID=UPI003F659369
MQYLGDRIKYLRETKNLIQKDLADTLDIYKDYLLERTTDYSPIRSSNLEYKEHAKFEVFINNPQHGIDILIRRQLKLEADLEGLKHR